MDLRKKFYRNAIKVASALILGVGGPVGLGNAHDAALDALSARNNSTLSNTDLSTLSSSNTDLSALSSEFFAGGIKTYAVLEQSPHKPGFHADIQGVVTPSSTLG